MSYAIPSEINGWDRLQTAEFYHRDLGWAVHALCPPNRGPEPERGKKPIAKGWRTHTAGEVTPDYLREHFASGANYNLGVVVRGPFVHVDLDSKPDAGASVHAWLATQPQLAGVPRERTGGGAHLVFVCRDLPESVAAAKKAITAQITPAVTAEFYTDGMNLVLSPSVHKSGTRYTWDITGPIPEVSWDQIRQWFGFDEPEGAAKRGRPAKERPWWARFKGALHSLDAVALFTEAELLGDCIDPDAGKWTVRCPWENEHSKARSNDTAPDSGKHDTDTVLFGVPASGGESPPAGHAYEYNDTTSPVIVGPHKGGAHNTRMPGFKCLHAHCAERSLRDVLEWLEDQKPGMVDRHCREMRVWADGQTSSDGRQRVILPELDRPDSEFAMEMSKHIGPRNVWFNKAESVVAVSMRRFSENITALSFQPLQPIEACTAAEQFVETGVVREDKESGDMLFLRHTMSRECAAKLIAAPQFRRKLPEIIRILDVPLPIRTPGGGIVFPEYGYDTRFRSYLDHDAPRIRPMPFDRALELLREVHADFGWRDAQSLTHALARIITPMCRGLMGWDARFPLWHYSANRPRAGKDYLAGVTQLLYEGRTCEDAPLERESEETRKRITAALMAGRRMMHFANCQGYIQDAAFIGAVTTKTFGARNLGSTEAKADLTMPNEIEFSISANVGLTFREDVEPRTRRISLVFFEENANGRQFTKPDLHGWVMQHRSELLSAIGALVKRWIDSGCPKGATPFNSFPEWSRVVGGIMHACGLGDPCLPHASDEGEIGGDLLEKAMRALYRTAFESYPNTWLEKGELFKLIAHADDEDLSFLGSFCDDSVARETKRKIGRNLGQFRNRELEGIVLEVDARGKGERQMVRFVSSDTNSGRSTQVVFELFGSNGNNGSSTGCIEHGEEKFREKKEKKRELNRVQYTGRGDTSVTSVTSTIGSVATFENLASEILAAGDIETFGPRKADALNPWRGDIRLLSLKIEGVEPWLIDLQSTGYNLGPLAAALEAVVVIAHNARFDALWLAVKCGVRLQRVFCTLTAARLLAAGTRPGNDFDTCLERYLGIKPAAAYTDHSSSDWGGMFLTDDQLAYAARDVAHLQALKDVLTLKLDQAGLTRVAELEMALLPVVVVMEQAGMAVDKPQLESLRDQAKAEADLQTAALREAIGNRHLNPASPQQLVAALERAGVTVANTEEETLKATGDTRVVPILLAHRSAEKAAQQAQSLLDCVQADGRIHGRFDPTGTATGRFSSKEPNLQNIGRGHIRECFIAPPGSKLVVADYSQIELRAAAAIAGETKMIEAYQRREDLHRGTAAAVLAKPASDVSKADRQLSKAVNFGLLYGQSAPGLKRYAAASYGVTIEDEDAREIRSRFFRTYGSLRQWHGESHRSAEAGISEVRTVLGRRRIIPPEASAWERFTALVNTPVQGGCADGMKSALVRLAAALPSTARIISTVHDEIIVEVPEPDAETVRQLTETIMIQSMADLFPQVPIEVEAHICSHWGEK